MANLNYAAHYKSNEPLLLPLDFLEILGYKDIVGYSAFAKA
ncbi:hypothetical protein [Nonlabens spongiae]|nr:hypothetical protein [Nonlabens spongiae]